MKWKYNIWFHSIVQSKWYRIWCIENFFRGFTSDFGSTASLPVIGLVVSVWQVWGLPWWPSHHVQVLSYENNLNLLHRFDTDKEKKAAEQSAHSQGEDFVPLGVEVLVDGVRLQPVVVELQHAERIALALTETIRVNAHKHKHTHRSRKPGGH